MTMAVVVLMLTAASIQAEVIYDFAGTGTAFTTFSGTIFPAEPVAFQLTVPNFVNPAVGDPAVEFTCAQLDSNTNCFIGIFFSKGTSAFPAALQFDAADDVAYIFYFPTGAFGVPGTYSSENLGPPSNLGTLTVTQTPEPATLLLVLGGACLCGRRRSPTKRSTGA